MPDIPPVEEIEGDLDSGLLFLCDHARPDLPAAYGSLGLPPEAFTRHIAYDIGAAALTRVLARRFRAPALLTTWSRLLIDPNRGRDDPTLVMQLSDGQIVPGNHRIDRTEVDRRIARFYDPYDAAIARVLDAFGAAHKVPIVVSMHSFTPIWRGRARPWHVAVLWDADPRAPKPLIRALAEDPTIVVGDNEPYDGALKGDTLYRHVTVRGLPNALIEVRQDLIADAKGVDIWAGRIERALGPLLADAALRRIEYWGSRTGPIAPRP